METSNNKTQPSNVNRDERTEEIELLKSILAKVNDFDRRMEKLESRFLQPIIR